MTTFRSVTRFSAIALAVLVSAVPAYGQSPKSPRDLSRLPEVVLDRNSPDPTALDPSNPFGAARERIRNSLGAANQLNKTRIDGFVEDLMKNRPDLKGLSFAMGEACRMDKDRQRAFAIAGESTHHAVGHTQRLPNRAAAIMETFQKNYWIIDAREGGVVDPDNFGRAVVPGSVQMFFQLQKVAAAKRSAPETAKRPVAAAQVAALMQILTPESAEVRIELINYLRRIPYAEASRALAKLAIYSDEAEVRQAACAALQSRRLDEYQEVLAAGLDYPLVEVAERASDAIVRLKHKDMVPQLIAMLDRPEPGTPTFKDAGGEKVAEKVAEIREVVRVNHHKNCMLCHPPGNTPDVPATAIKAQVAIPGEPFPQSQNGYESFGSDLVVRVDVTYLRQDFSRMMPVANPGVWPEKQRFDFLVRTRTLSEQETQAALAKLETKSDAISPYHLAAASALRTLTGRDAEPTAAAWRKALEK